MIHTRLPIFFTALLCFSLTTQAEGLSISDTACDFRSVIAEDLHSLVKKQITDIENVLQQCARNINDAASMPARNKECARRQIATLQKHINTQQLDNFSELDETTLFAILETNKVIINYIADGCSNNFNNTAAFDTEQITKRSFSDVNVSLNGLVSLYGDVEAQLNDVTHAAKKSSISCMTRLARTTDRTISDWHIDTITSKSLKYFALLSYWTYITAPKDVTEKLPLLSPFKTFIGGATDDKETVVQATINLNELVNPEILSANKEILKKAKCKTETKTIYDKEKGPGAFLSSFGLFKINLEDAIKISVVASLTPFIYDDMKELGKWGSRKCADLRAYLTETPVVDTTATVKTVETQAELTETERAEHLNKVCFRLCINPDKLNTEYIARATSGCSAHDLDSIMEHALAQATKNNLVINAQHIEKSIDKLVRHIADIDSETCPIKRSMLAAQYAGQAVAHVCLKPCTELVKVTIMPVGNNSAETTSGEMFTIYRDCSQRETLKEEMLKACCIELAPIVSQDMLTGSCSYELLKTCKERAFAIVHELVLEGMDPKNLPKKVAQEQLSTALKLLDKCLIKVKELLAEQQAALGNVAQALRERSTLTGEEVAAIINS